MKATAGVGRVAPSESILRFFAAFLPLIHLAGVLRIFFKKLLSLNKVS